MALKLNTVKKKYCIPYKDEETEETLAKFYVTPLTPPELKRVMEKHRVIEWDSPDKKTKKERFETYDYLGITYDRMDKSIVAWEGVENQDGEPLECTRQNKLDIFNSDPKVFNYIMGQVDELEENEEEEREEERKN